MLRRSRRHTLSAEAADGLLRSQRGRLPAGPVSVIVDRRREPEPLSFTLSIESRRRKTPFEITLRCRGGVLTERYLLFPGEPLAMRVRPPSAALPVGTITVEEIGSIGLIRRFFATRRKPLARAIAYFRLFGLKATIGKLVRLIRPVDEQDYGRWIELYDTLSEADDAAIRRRIDAMAARPVISLLMTIAQADPALLQRAIVSVIEQLYPDWQLCIALTPEAERAIGDLVRDVARGDPRIVISTGTDPCLDLATGSVVGVMGATDAMPRHALFVFAETIAIQPDAIVIYADQDEIDPAGRRLRPYFKPDWNPELFYATAYIGRPALLSRAVVAGVGGWRSRFGTASEYDLLLRVTAAARAEQIRHVPHILYHRDPLQEPMQGKAGELAVAEFLGFPALCGRVESTPDGAIRRIVRAAPDPLPHVAIIIPTRDRVDLLRNCVAGILERTDYPNLSVTIVDNDSREEATRRYLAEIVGDPRVRVLPIGGPFNYSRLNNLTVAALAASTGDLVGFLNNDLEVIDPGWLREMVAQAVLPGVGAVGAKLYYGDETIQHGGVMLGLGGIAGHIHRGLPRDDPGYFGRLFAVQNIACVTAACLVMSRAVFEAVGGFDEQELAVAFNDVDLCLRIRAAGYSLVWTPHAELFHLESASRGEDYSGAKARRFEREHAVMRRRWAAELDADPFYNPNLSLFDEQCGLAFPPRVSKPWAGDR